MLACIHVFKFLISDYINLISDDSDSVEDLPHSRSPTPPSCSPLSQDMESQM